MYNSPNNCNTLEQIDRDIRRVEDKTDTNAAIITQQAEQIGQNNERITRNEANIACLGKRLEDAKACGIDTYCKETVDCKLAAKADKCEFEKHLINPHAHEELFDRKVDKQDGFGLISDNCLAQICQNKDGLMILERYIRELQEQNACLKEEMAKTARKTAPIEYELELSPGTTSLGMCTYFKTQEELVCVNLYVTKEDNSVFAVNDIIGFIPVGFRPRRPAGALVTTDSYPITGNRGVARVAYEENGSLILADVSDLTNAKMLTGQLIWLALE